MGLTREEQETLAGWCEADDHAYIYSTRKELWRMCEKAGWTLHLEDGGGREYRGPRSELKIRVRSVKKLQGAALEGARQRLAAATAARHRKNTKEPAI